MLEFKCEDECANCDGAPGKLQDLIPNMSHNSIPKHVLTSQRVPHAVSPKLESPPVAAKAGRGTTSAAIQATGKSTCGAKA